MPLTRTPTVRAIASLLMAVAAVATTGAYGAPPQAAMLRVGDRALDTRAEPNLLTAATAPFDPATPYIIQLDGPMTPARRRLLRTAGVGLEDYLPDHAYVARLRGVSPDALRQLGFIRWAGRVRPQWKLSPAIGHRLLPFQTPTRQQLAAQGKLKLIVTIAADADPDAVKTGLVALGAEITGTSVNPEQRHIYLTATSDALAAIAAINAVEYVEEAPEITLRNSTTRWIVQSNQLDVTPLYDHGIHGEGQIVGVLDGQPDQDHCSLDGGKILAYNAADGNDFHGTHVSATAVGDNGLNDNTRGIAYAANMVYNTVPSFTETGILNRLNLHHTQGARIHTNSWGDDGTTSYNSLARGFDLFSYNNEEDLVCLAVTNTSTLRNPENAKNLLAVGASQDTPNQSSHCSGGTGPTADGRRKPEIYAPGCGTISAVPSACGTAALTGTSMASPAVAGTAALVRQYFVDGYYPSGTATPADALTPSGALIKAVLLNSAADMTGVSGYPSDLEGWGRVLADNALFFPGDARGLQLLADVRNASGLSTGQMLSYFVTVTGSVEDLRVTLVWTEPPASALTGTGSATVNDLDLEVEAPDTTLYLGNVFAGGFSTTGGTADAKNNVEQVHISAPSTGVWTVRVSASAINQDTQGFALIATGQVGGDCNNNAVPDTQDITGGTSLDCNTNLIPDECEKDCNTNAIADSCDITAATSTDLNTNSVPDECEDCNGNGIPDDLDINFDTSADCNVNAIPDECDIAAGTSTDCNTNGIADECDQPDCNVNQRPDSCDLADMTSSDCNNNGVPDECDQPDCNANNRPDSCDLADMTSTDCNGNGIPDECESPDCNGNNFPDDCDLSGGTSADCNGNLVPDECDKPDCNSNSIPDACDIISMFSADCNANQIPDECEFDCNSNGVADDCDVTSGASADCDANGIPDECDVAADIEDCRFPVNLSENTTTSPDAFYAGPPDDVSGDLADNQVTYDFRCGLVFDGPGADLTVYGRDTAPVQFADIIVWVSADGANFTSIKSTETGAVAIPGDEAHGASVRARSYDIGTSGLGLVRYVRIDGVNAAGGFPLDAIGAVHMAALDCDASLVPDACELAAGSASDCNSNGVVDTCDGDCNQNGLADECDLSAGTAPDCNSNNVIDTCEPSRSAFAIDLDGVDDYVDAGTGLDFTDNFTIEAWILADDVITKQQLIAKHQSTPNAGYALFIEDAKLVFTNLGVQRYETAPVLSPGLWTHVAAVFDASRDVTFYMNGQAVQTVFGSVGVASSSGPVFMGAFPPSGGNYYDGLIDEVRVWSVARGPAAIAADMSGPLTGSEPNLVAYWRMETGTGTVAVDTAGTNNATLANGAAWFGIADDCNMNGVLDECDIAFKTESDCNANHIPDTCADVPAGDCDCNLIVDTADFPLFESCLAGPGAAPASTACGCADLDGDGDVDLADFNLLLEAMAL